MDGTTLDPFGAGLILDNLFSSTTTMIKGFVSAELPSILLGILILNVIFLGFTILYGVVESASYSNSVTRIRDLDARAKASAHDPAASAIYRAAYRDEVAHFSKVHGKNFRDRERENPGHLWGYSPGGERASSEFKDTSYETDFVTGSRKDDFCGPLPSEKIESKKDSVWDAWEDSRKPSFAQNAARDVISAKIRERSCDND